MIYIPISSRDTHKRRAQIKPLFKISPVALWEPVFSNRTDARRTYYNIILRLT